MDQGRNTRSAMENNSEKAGIKIKDSSNIRFINGRIDGYEVAIDADNVNDLSMENVKMKTTPASAKPELKWYKDFKFLASIVIPTILVIIGWIFFTN